MTGIWIWLQPKSKKVRNEEAAVQQIWIMANGEPQRLNFIFFSASAKNTCSSHHIDSVLSALEEQSVWMYFLKLGPRNVTQVMFLWISGRYISLLCSSSDPLAGGQGIWGRTVQKDFSGSKVKTFLSRPKLSRFLTINGPRAFESLPLEFPGRSSV